MFCSVISAVPVCSADERGPGKKGGGGGVDLKPGRKSWKEITKCEVVVTGFLEVGDVRMMLCLLQSCVSVGR